MLRRSIVGVAVAIGFVLPVRAADLHVSATGNDAASGSVDAPVASLRRALDRVREIRAAEPGRRAGPGRAGRRRGG